MVNVHSSKGMYSASTRVQSLVIKLQSVHDHILLTSHCYILSLKHHKKIKRLNFYSILTHIHPLIL